MMLTITMPVVAQSPLVIPTPEEAKGAVVRMFDEPVLTKAMQRGEVKIGTCKKTTKATHDGEVSCNVLVVTGAASSETQANLYRQGTTWVATPSEEDLPFPDPKLR